MKTENEIIDFINKAKKYACKKKFPQYADDFSQEAAIAFYQNKNDFINMDFLWISFLRKQFGEGRSKKGKAKSEGRLNQLFIDNILEQRLISHDSIDEFLTKDELYKFTHLFEGKKEYIFIRYYIEDETEIQISKELGVTESRISQLIKDIRNIIKDYYILNEAKDRFNIEDNFGVFEIDWIKI